LRTRSQANTAILISKYVDVHYQLDGAILFFKVILNTLRVNAKNEIASNCAKFGADLVNIFQVTRCGIAL